MSDPNPAAHLTVADLCPDLLLGTPAGIARDLWDRSAAATAAVLGDLTDDALTGLHTIVHQEWRRRYPAGDWPTPELQERRAELIREFRQRSPTVHPMPTKERP